MATLDDVRELALALPASTERSSYGTPGFRVKDRLFARWRARAPKRLLAELDHQPIFRAPMRARDLDLPPGAGADVGLAHNLVGIGDVADRTVARFAELPDGTFVWTRSSDGLFHLGRIAGPRVDGAEAALAVGLRHVRPATWLDRPLREDEVPPAVAATFARGGRNLQRTHDADAERLTAELWASAGAPRP